MAQANLKDEVLDLIFEAVNMKQFTKNEVGLATPLMAGGLGLDSIDILEVVIAVERRYNIQIENNEANRNVFANVGSLTQHIETQSQKTGG